MRMLEVNQTFLGYTEQGTGLPLVLIHGSASDYRTWQAQVESFATQYRVITYSRRHHWPNAPIPKGADYSMLEHLDDLKALLYSLGAAPAHLVGHSYGAVLALLLAISHPSLVRSLVLSEAPAFTLFVSDPPRTREILRLCSVRPRLAMAVIKFGLLGFAPARAAAKRGDMEAALRRFGRAVLGREHFQRLSSARLEQARANTFRSEFLGSGLLPLPADQVRRVATPVLLITGEQSPVVFHRLADALAELIPLAERINVPDAAHIVHENNPAAFSRAVLSFLKRH